jgi:hypothetical protein
VRLCSFHTTRYQRRGMAIPACRYDNYNTSSESTDAWKMKIMKPMKQGMRTRLNG